MQNLNKALDPTAPRRGGCWLGGLNHQAIWKNLRMSKMGENLPTSRGEHTKYVETTYLPNTPWIPKKAFWQWLRDPQVTKFFFWSTTSQMRRNGIFTYIWPRWMGGCVVVNVCEITLKAPWEWNIYLHWSYKFKPFMLGKSWSPIRRIWDCCVKCWIFQQNKTTSGSMRYGLTFTYRLDLFFVFFGWGVYDTFLLLTKSKGSVEPFKVAIMKFWDEVKIFVWRSSQPY